MPPPLLPSDHPPPPTPALAGSLAGLTYLSLSQCTMLADRRAMHVTTLGQLLGCFTSLTELELAGMRQVTDANMVALGR